MAKAKCPAFDAEAAHKYFAAHCFNRAWDLMEKKERTAEDDRLMFALNQASIYRWLQRPAAGRRRGLDPRLQVRRKPLSPRPVPPRRSDRDHP